MPGASLPWQSSFPTWFRMSLLYCYSSPLQPAWQIHGLAGYAVAGRSLERGYLQRLAVDPAHQGHGLGTALVLDALWWLRRRGATSTLVNTQEANDAALALYERLGFRRQAEGLAVLHRPLEPASP